MLYICLCPPEKQFRTCLIDFNFENLLPMSQNFSQQEKEEEEIGLSLTPEEVLKEGLEHYQQHCL